MRQYHVADFTVPAGTAIAAPLVQALPLEDGVLEQVRIVIPPGHSGLTGLRITSGGTQLVPVDTGTWVIADSEIIDFAWSDEVTAKGLSAAGYNTDVYPHTFHLRFTFADPKSAAPVAVSSPQFGGGPAATGQGAAIAALAVTLPEATARGGQLAAGVAGAGGQR